MGRRRFSERQVIETLIRQGAVIRSYRSKEPITLENIGTVEREHILERALGGEDTPANCAYSLGKEHAVVTNGTKATTANSSKQRIAKVKRLKKARAALTSLAGGNATAPGRLADARTAVTPPGWNSRCHRCGEYLQGGICPNCIPKSQPVRKIRSPGFAKLPKRQAVRG